MVRLPKTRRPTHPGQILLTEFLEPLGMPQKALANAVGMSYVRVNELVNGKRGVTTDTALRLGRLFDIEPEFWLNLQRAYDLWGAQRDKKTKRALEKIAPIQPTV